jgi:hypothetical protein
MFSPYRVNKTEELTVSFSRTIKLAFLTAGIAAAAGCSNAVDDGHADDEHTNTTEQAATVYPPPPADVLAKAGFTYLGDRHLVSVLDSKCLTQMTVSGDKGNVGVSTCGFGGTQRWSILQKNNGTYHLCRAGSYKLREFDLSTSFDVSGLIPSMLCIWRNYNHDLVVQQVPIGSTKNNGTFTVQTALDSPAWQVGGGIIGVLNSTRRLTNAGPTNGVDVDPPTGNADQLWLTPPL